MAYEIQLGAFCVCYCSDIQKDRRAVNRPSAESGLQEEHRGGNAQAERSALLINNYHYRRGGAESVYLESGELLKEEGWDISWFSMHHPKNVEIGDQELFAATVDLEITTGVMAKASAALAVVYNTEARDRLAETIDRYAPAVVHAHNIYHHLSPSVLRLLRSRGIPTVLTAHDLKLACPSYKMLRNGAICEACKGGRVWNVARYRCVKDSAPLSLLVGIESAVHKGMRMYSGNLNRIVVPSRFYLEKLIQWGWPATKLVYIPNFVAIPTASPPYSAGNQAIAYIGRLSEEKGLSTLIKASALSRVPVAIVGTGPIHDQLQGLVQQLGAPVTFSGYLTGEDLSKVMRSAKAIVLPSEWYENAPMSVLEAYAMGRPVLGSNIGGIPELVFHGDTGWLFTPGDPGSLADALTQVSSCSDSELTRMGTNGWFLVSERFSRRRHAEALSRLYLEVIEEGVG